MHRLKIYCCLSERSLLKPQQISSSGHKVTFLTAVLDHKTYSNRVTKGVLVMARIIEKDEPTKEVIVERDHDHTHEPSTSSNTGAIIAVVIIVLIILLLLFGRGFGGRGGGGGTTNINVPNPTTSQ